MKTSNYKNKNKNERRQIYKENVKWIYLKNIEKNDIIRQKNHKENQVPYQNRK